MQIDTKTLGEKAFVVVLADNDTDWIILEGEIIGVIASVEKQGRNGIMMYHTWVQYKIETEHGPHVISEEYVYPEKPAAKERCQLLNRMRLS